MSLAALLGIEYPLLQAPMAGVQDARLAIAVSGAGGLGALPCAMLSPDQIREQVARMRAETDRPFNLNFFCHAPPQPDPARESAWLARLAPDYAEWNVAPPAMLDAGTRRPFDAEALALLRDLRPPVVSFHFGLPDADAMSALREWNCIVLSSATTREEAQWLQARGVDAVIAQGWEAGGHRATFLRDASAADALSAQPGTFALVSQLVAALDVPVIAAGGIVDAAGVAKAEALGARGVQIGTAYLCCPEADTHAVHRAALQDASATTVVTNVLSGRPARGIVNRAIAQWGPISDDVPAFPVAASAIAPLRRAAEAAGCGDYSPLWSGQDRSACREVPAAQLTRELARGFAATRPA